MTSNNSNAGSEFNPGLGYAVAAFTFWGIVPVYWKYLDHVDSIEVVVHRMVWSFFFVGFLVVSLEGWRVFKPYLRDPKLLFRLSVASIIFSSNAGIYIWAIHKGYIIECAMGYFISPLGNVLFGWLFFGERLRVQQWLAILLALSAVAYLIFGYGTFPFIALSLAITFGTYGALKKGVSLSATHGMAIETAFVLVPSVIYLVYLKFIHVGIFGKDAITSAMLVTGGLLTLIPLLLFSAAAKLISMTTLGMTQYIGPSIQLVLGVFIYNEAFGPAQQISFGLIWLALVIYSIDQLISGRQRNN